MDLPGEEVQLTRCSAANITVAPVRRLVALAALRGTEGSPLLAAQAAVAPREGMGMGAPQHPAHGLAGFPNRCCRDTTEMLLWEGEVGADAGPGSERAAASPLPARQPQKQGQNPVPMLCS